MLALLIMVAVFVAAVALTLGAVRGLDPSAVAGSERLRWLNGWKLWHVLVAILFLALVFAAFSAHDGELPAFLAAVLVLVLFLRAWRHEFLFLMSLRDDEFPGRFDKLVWVFALTLFAPIGLWFFRSYRLAHWPEPEPVKGHPARELFS
jgi:hypothetical protein